VGGKAGPQLNRSSGSISTDLCEKGKGGKRKSLLKLGEKTFYIEKKSKQKKNLVLWKRRRRKIKSTIILCGGLRKERGMFSTNS